MRYLVTGAAGFIGYHVSHRLLKDGHQVVGIDNLNDYYDVGLKQARLGRLEGLPGFQFLKLDISDTTAMRTLFASSRFECVIHLAAQAGVRYSLLNPDVYAQSNLVGQLNVLEGCRHSGVPHLVYASSSSVYGLNAKVPFSEQDPTDHPVSLYAATKRAGELMAHTYSHLYGLPTTGLRFFTVYGPWGRPDMAYFKFAESILDGKPIDIFGGVEQRRDFTYIDDVVEAIARVATMAPTPTAGGPAVMSDPSRSSAPFRILNVGNRHPVSLPDFIATLERCLGHTAVRRDVGPQPGDVLVTFADTAALEKVVGYRPETTLGEGLKRFAEWFLEYRTQPQ
ncbi:MAG: NAD-dependent epimerase [Gemmatimonadales bacterium]|nr:MAG: NAD-dependent epimerase [Gemmatimonadales bacterium]